MPDCWSLLFGEWTLSHLNVLSHKGRAPQSALPWFLPVPASGVGINLVVPAQHTGLPLILVRKLGGNSKRRSLSTSRLRPIGSEGVNQCLTVGPYLYEKGRSGELYWVILAGAGQSENAIPAVLET